MAQRSEEEVRSELRRLFEQRDAVAENPTARQKVNDRIAALAWVLQHEKVPTLVLSDEAVAFLECLW